MRFQHLPERPPPSRRQPAAAALASRWIFLGITALLLSACSRSHRLYPQFPDSEHPVRQVAIIPLEASLRTQEVGSIVGSSRESQLAFRRSLTESLQAALLSHGIGSIAPFDPSSEGGVSPCPSLPRSTIAEAAIERKKALSDIAFTDRGGFLRTRSFNPPVYSVLSEALPEVASCLKVDALLLMHVSAVELSAADYSLEVVRSALLALGTAFLGATWPHQTFITAEILAVDGRSGRVFFFNSIEGSSADPKDQAELRDLMEELTLPLAEAISRDARSP